MRIYTRHGDDGTTGLLYGGRVPKTAPAIVANGDVDEAQAHLGLARAANAGAAPLEELLVALERDLYVLMAEVATDPANHHKLEGGRTLVTEAMVTTLEGHIDRLTAGFPPLRDFTIPGHDPVTAALDVARTVVRRAERSLDALRLAAGDTAPASWAPAYLNRLSDLVWTMARWYEHGETLRAKDLAGTTPTEPR